MVLSSLGRDFSDVQVGGAVDLFPALGRLNVNAVVARDRVPEQDHALVIVVGGQLLPRRSAEPVLVGLDEGETHPAVGHHEDIAVSFEVRLVLVLGVDGTVRQGVDRVLEGDPVLQLFRGRALLDPAVVVDDEPAERRVVGGVCVSQLPQREVVGHGLGVLDDPVVVQTRSPAFEDQTDVEVEAKQRGVVVEHGDLDSLGRFSDDAVGGVLQADGAWRSGVVDGGVTVAAAAAREQVGVAVAVAAGEETEVGDFGGGLDDGELDDAVGECGGGAVVDERHAGPV